MNGHSIAWATIRTATSVIGLGVAFSVQALPYALSYNNLTNGNISFLGPVFPILPSPINSIASASLGNAPAVHTGGVGAVNAPEAEIGVDKVDNDMTPVGPGGNYARGDAQIVSQQSQGAPFIQVWNIAEASVDTDIQASASAQNGSNTPFVFFTAGGGALAIEFDVDPYMQIIMPAGLATPSVVSASFTVELSITDEVGNVVFAWAPDGFNAGAGGVTGSIGGTELLDPFDLNTTISRDFSTPGPTTYDPTGGGDADVGALTPTTVASYAVITNPLPAGLYTINLLGTESVSIDRMSVPQPASLALLGLGLAALILIRRR